MGRGLRFPSGPAMTHWPASGTPAPWTVAISLPGPVRLGRGMGGCWIGRDAYTQGVVLKEVERVIPGLDLSGCCGASPTVARLSELPSPKCGVLLVFQGPYIVGLFLSIM